MARILAISHDAYLYGAQRSLLDVVAGLAQAGHEVEVCVPATGALVPLLRELRIPVHVVPFLRWIRPAAQSGAWDWLRLVVGFPAAVWRATRLLRRGRYNVVYTNTVTVVDFAVAAKLARVPHVWHLRESAVDHPQLRSPVSNRRVAAVARALSRRVIYNSNYLLACYGPSVAGKDVVVYNGLPVPPAPVGTPERLDGRMVVLTAGFMDRGKGLDILLDALALLPPDLRDRTVLRVAGDIEGGYMAREIAPRLQHLGATVELLGWVADLRSVLAGVDLLVSCSRHEPFGRTLVEAMMLGLPVLATRSGGPEEIVVDRVTGLLVPPGDPHALSKALSCMLQEPELRAACGRAGRVRAQAQFSLEASVREVERCLLDAMAPSPGARPMSSS